MYSFPYLEPVSCPMSSPNCCFLTYIQISQEAGQLVWYSHLLKYFPQVVVIHTVKGLTLLLFRWSSRCWHLISGSSAFSKTSLNSWKFTVHVLLKPGLENFEHYFTSVWDECNCAIVWAFFGIAFLKDWNWKLTFSSPVAIAEFSKFACKMSAALSQHHLLEFEIAQPEFHHLH